MNVIRTLVTAAALHLAAACGGGAVPPPEPISNQGLPTSPPPASPGTGSVVPTAWSKDMPKDQKIAFMKAHVVPQMQPVFQGANAARYADFGCKTCHGPAFVEPREFLPRLTMKDGRITAFAEKPEIAKFMAESVVPQMASAMGLAPLDPKTGQGFGCLGCHAAATQ
jgi:hypothetical protein